MAKGLYLFSAFLIFGVYVSAQRSQVAGKTLRNLQGKWVCVEDSLSAISIRNNIWEFGYTGFSIEAQDRYSIRITKHLPQFAGIEVKSRFLTLVNHVDTLYYELLGVSDSVLSLLYLPSGHISVYRKAR